jgi:hypothetical protein
VLTDRDISLADYYSTDQIYLEHHTYEGTDEPGALPMPVP